jgi:hypothetical protein
VSQAFGFVDGFGDCSFPIKDGITTHHDRLATHNGNLFDFDAGNTI